MSGYYANPGADGYYIKKTDAGDTTPVGYSHYRANIMDGLDQIQVRSVTDPALSQTGLKSQSKETDLWKIVTKRHAEVQTNMLSEVKSAERMTLVRGEYFDAVYETYIKAPYHDMLYNYLITRADLFNKAIVADTEVEAKAKMKLVIETVINNDKLLSDLERAKMIDLLHKTRSDELYLVFIDHWKGASRLTEELPLLTRKVTYKSVNGERVIADSYIGINIPKIKLLIEELGGEIVPYPKTTINEDLSPLYITWKGQYTTELMYELGKEKVQELRNVLNIFSVAISASKLSKEHRSYNNLKLSKILDEEWITGIPLLALLERTYVKTYSIEERMMNANREISSSLLKNGGNFYSCLEGYKFDVQQIPGQNAYTINIQKVSVGRNLWLQPHEIKRLIQLYQINIPAVTKSGIEEST